MSSRLVIREKDPPDLASGDPEPGEYVRLHLEGDRLTAALACPECGQLASLYDHQIGPDGRVEPSVVCPGDGCSFHTYVRLEGWGEDA